MEYNQRYQVQNLQLRRWFIYHFNMYCIYCNTSKSVRNCLILYNMGSQTCHGGIKNISGYSIS